MAEVDMTEAANASREEVVDTNLENMTTVSVDDLMADVMEVQTILKCNNVGHVVDVNEIYEKLEELTYIRREERIEYVATQLLHKLGVVDDPEVAPEERVFRFSQCSSEDSLATNSSCSDERSATSEVSGSGGTKTENDIPFSNEIFTGCSVKDDMNVKYVNVPSTAILALVNNENQQNSHDCNIKIQPDCCQKFCVDDKTLMDEAELIHSILPHHHIEQICTCLEAYKDNDIRVHIVTEIFLQIDSESEVAQLSCAAEVPVATGIVESTMTGPTCGSETLSCSETLDCNKYPVNADVSPQETVAVADLKCGSLHNSELPDIQMCQEININVASELLQTCDNVDSETEHANRLETEVQHNDRNVYEGNIEVIPSVREEKASEETVEVISSSVERNVGGGSCKIIRYSSYRDITNITDTQSGDAVIDYATSDPEDDDTPLYISCSDLSTIIPDAQRDSGTYNTDNNSDSNKGCEANGRPPSCSMFAIVQSQSLPETSAVPFVMQDSGIVECTTSQQVDVQLNGLSEEIGGIITDCEMVYPESDTDGTVIFENKLQSGVLDEVQVEHDVSAVAVAEEQCSVSSQQSSVLAEEQYESFESENSDDLLTLIDDLYEEQTHDKKIGKLRELFPDARIDYLKKLSYEYDSLTDMANKVLECPQGQSDGVGDVWTMGMPSVSALGADPPSQGCRKKEITYEEFRSSLPHFDEELLMGVWEGIGNNYSKVKEFITLHKKETSPNDRYYTLLTLFPHADPAFLRKKCSMLGNSEVAFEEFIEDQLQNKTDPQYRTLQAMFPQLDSTFLRKKCDEFGDDETSMRAFVMEQLQQNDVDDWYHSLLSMFPEKDPAALRESIKCIGNDAEAMRLFVAQQLDEMEGVKFATLLAVLPDADPDYLLASFQRIGNDENSVKEFLLEALEKKDYPTREAYLKRQEMAALQRKYKEEFSIEEFIQMFPDPWKHFCEENNNNDNELLRNHEIAYLETRYRRISLDDIRSSFKKTNHNLALTCSELDKWNGPVQPLRETYECTVPKTEDIPVQFLQEVAFIENEHKIKDFVDTQEQWRKELYEQAKANGELLECMCCFDAELIAEDMAACNEGHLFCKECIRRSAEIAIGSAQNGFSCLTSCNAEFSLKVLRSVLKSNLFSRMVQKKQLEEVQAAGIEDLENCPFCGFSTVPPPDSTVFVCHNPNCMRDSCRRCKRPNHIPQRCEEVESKEVKMRTFIENRMTDALVRSCWQCKKNFIKEAGCNKMTCTCGARMCYICRQPVTDYTHFNGQGGTEFEKCPLYSDLEVIHDVAVQEEGIKAKKEIQAANPDVELKHDPTDCRGTEQ